MSNDRNFSLNLPKTCDEQTLKISSQYLEQFQIYCHLTEKCWQLSAYMYTKQANLYACRPTIARIFQLNGNKSKTAQDIDLKFSAFVHHMSGVNWQKNFGHCSISRSVAPSSMQKLCTPLATIFVEKNFWKKFWCGFRPIRVTPWKEFLISLKKWRFEIFWTTALSRASGPCINTDRQKDSWKISDHYF